jgi:hypothetical protein
MSSEAATALSSARPTSVLCSHPPGKIRSVTQVSERRQAAGADGDTDRAVAEGADVAVINDNGHVRAGARAQRIERRPKRALCVARGNADLLAGEVLDDADVGILSQYTPSAVLGKCSSRQRVPRATPMSARPSIAAGEAQTGATVHRFRET